MSTGRIASSPPRAHTYAMRHAVLALAILMQASLPLARAQEGCPNTCPEGTVRSQETGKCEPYKPLMV